MDSQYHTAMPPLSTFYPAGYPPIMPPPPPDLFQPRLHHLQTFSMDNTGNYPEMSDPNLVTNPHQQGSQRSKRRQLVGGDHVKHRRTRSGCYTCRQRRVKCDETRPVCDRCRKGKRDCIYPESSSSSRSDRRGSKLKGISESSSPSGDEHDDDEKQDLSAIPDDEDDDDGYGTEPVSARSDSQASSSVPGWPSIKNESSTAESSSVFSRAARPSASRTSSKQSIHSGVLQHSKLSYLSKEDKAYLKYHQEHLTYHHYAFKYDAGDFLKTTFLEIAMNDESQALLFAIIAFSAYHRSIERQDYKISVFLSYYNKSIMLLQQSLKSKKPGIATLLTVLQLATIEEFLGDWTNLMGHQKAAHQILTDLFNPQTIMQDETRRRIIAWYIRFDLFAGMMSGSETRLGRPWFAACHEHYTRQARDRPDDLGAKFEEYFATSRLYATDVALLFARNVGGMSSDEQFAVESGELMAKFEVFGRQLEAAFTDPLNYVKEFPKAPPPRPDDITNFRDPYFLRAGELFTMNFVLLDFWAIDLMFKYNMAKLKGMTNTSELTSIALNSCKMFEAVQYSAVGPEGAIIGCQASLGIASLFLPKDQRHTTWSREKFALIEQLGYIYPPTFRQQLSGEWGIDVTEWWLPNSEDTQPHVIRAIREFVAYRATRPKDEMDMRVRDMTNIFGKVEVEEVSSSAGTDAESLSPLHSREGGVESSPEGHWHG